MSMTADARDVSDVAKNLLKPFTPEKRNQMYDNNSINFREMQGKLANAREKMKS
jgi:hypothetical protein